MHDDARFRIGNVFSGSMWPPMGNRKKKILYETLERAKRIYTCLRATGLRIFWQSLAFRLQPLLLHALHIRGRHFIGSPAYFCQQCASVATQKCIGRPRQILNQRHINKLKSNAIGLTNLIFTLTDWLESLPSYCIRQSSQIAFDPNYQINCDTKLPWRSVSALILMVQQPNRPLYSATNHPTKTMWFASSKYSLELSLHWSMDLPLLPNDFEHREGHSANIIKIDC